MTATITCPGGAKEHNQQGRDIARCRLTGMAQLLEGAPCCSEYTRCEIWQRAKERDWAHRKQVVPQKNVRTDGSLGWS